MISNRYDMNHKEENLQIACVRWFRMQYPNIIIHHSPNGGKRHVLTAIKFKAMGTLAGFPDLFIAYPSKGYHGLFVEMKNGKEGVVSRDQKAVLANLAAYGYKTMICRSYTEFIKYATAYIE